MITNKLIAGLMVTMVSVLFFTDSGFGQPYRHWSSSYATGFDDPQTTPFAFATDNKSNTIVAGEFNTVSLVYKLDSAGFKFWEYTDTAYRSTARSVSTDSLGNVFLAGFLDFQPTSIAYTRKFDMHGNLIWTRYYDNTLSDIPVKVLPDNDGNVYTIINSALPGDMMRIIILKHDNAGNTLFQTIVSDSSLYGTKCYDVLLDRNNNVIIGGGRVSYPPYLANLMICKISPSGSIIWKKFIENSLGSSTDFGSMALDGSGSVIVSSTFQIGPEFRSASYKFSNNGDSLWSFIPDINVLGMFGGAIDVCVDRSDNVIISVAKNGEYSPFLTLKLTSAGQIIWSREYNSGNPYITNNIGSVSCDIYDNIYVVGNMDSWWFNAPYAHLIKYDASGNTVWNHRVVSNWILTSNQGLIDMKGDLILMTKEGPIGQINISKYSDSLPVLELELSVLIQGRYDSITNQMMQDTGMVILHEANGQFNAIDTAKLLINSNGLANCSFRKTPISRNYYMEIRHRNSIPVWSSVPVMMLFGVSNNYTFIENPGSSFGSNMISVDDNPVRYALYTGDVNRDGFIDATDCSVIDNDAQNFASGYILSDLTGDGLTDADDLAIVSSNAPLFIESVRP